MSTQSSSNHDSSSQPLENDENLAPSHLKEDDTSAKKIESIRTWITNNESLNARTDDFTISRFLRYCKFDEEKTKKRMYNYYAQRTQSPEWFLDRNPFLPELQELFDLGYFLPLKDSDAEGRMIIILRPCIHNPRRQTFANLLKCGIMVLDIATKFEAVPLPEVIVIMDMIGVTLGHALQLSPNIIQRLVHSWQECYPFKIKSMNVVNAPYHIHVILNIFKRFMKPKLRERMITYSGTTDNFFVAHYPKSCHLLPVEFGGSSGTLQDLTDYWKNEAEKNHEWYVEEEKYRVL